jgi:superfamily I DNA and RNA helicase
MMMFPFIYRVLNCNPGPAQGDMVIAIAGAKRDGNCSELQELLNAYYTAHCRSLAAERVIGEAKSLNKKLHKLKNLSMINKVLPNNRVLIFAMQ